MASDIESLHYNKCSYSFKRAGSGGKEIRGCRLRKEAFKEIPTPTLKDGMSVREANAEWNAYLGALSRAGWRNPVIDPVYIKQIS